jgi:hypothetical protein
LFVTDFELLRLLVGFELMVAWAEEGNSNRKSSAAGRRASVDLGIHLDWSCKFVFHIHVKLITFTVFKLVIPEGKKKNIACGCRRSEESKQTISLSHAWRGRQLLRNNRQAFVNSKTTHDTGF